MFRWNIIQITEHKAPVVVIDEAPMLDKEHLESINEFFQDIMNNEKVFGGKVLVCAGDFRQILPVIKHANKAMTLELIIFAFIDYYVF